MDLGTAPTRRGMLALGAAAAAAPAWAAEDAASRLYSRAVVLDGTLMVSALTDARPLTASVAARIRASGLAALK